MHITQPASIFFKQLTCLIQHVLTCSTCEAVDEIRSTTESLQFDFPTIRVATENFSDANKLGEGGFGVVYKVI